MKRAMFIILLFACSIAPAQQRAVLDADSPRTPPRVQLNRGTASVTTGGVIDGGQAQPKSLMFQIRGLDLQAHGAAGNTVLRLETRLTNVSSASVEIPIGTDFDSVVTNCGNAPAHEADISISIETPGSTKQTLHMGNPHWFGCGAISGSVIALRPGEWITYRGTAQIPVNIELPTYLEGSWSLADLKFTAGNGGVIEDLSVHTVIVSPEEELR